MGLEVMEFSGQVFICVGLTSKKGLPVRGFKPQHLYLVSISLHFRCRTFLKVVSSLNFLSFFFPSLLVVVSKPYPHEQLLLL